MSINKLFEKKKKIHPFEPCLLIMLVVNIVQENPVVCCAMVARFVRMDTVELDVRNVMDQRYAFMTLGEKNALSVKDPVLLCSINRQ